MSLVQSVMIRYYLVILIGGLIVLFKYIDEMGVLERGILTGGVGFDQTTKQLQGTFVFLDLRSLEDLQCDFFPVEVVEKTEKGDRFSDCLPI